ncbi:ABC-2 family transporter protein [Dactylosporangium sp. AC04546]|uniref:ABC transporter permease n=1 Tax=Dactylosporangium sp. AC04546 TaxID=2862460 RepID=UPI001EE0CF14|nr:ABC-2 family transporter protein [Dactylosporangium sp. AC04546]WVK87593.1 ABC-2 family transporter protein [Dactylosporangium sp. AC04546]
MRAYRAFARATALSALAYRGSFLLSLGGIAFQLIALLAVWRVLLDGGASIGGFDWEHMRGYLLVAFAASALVGSFVDFRMSFRIRSGLIALDLVKPVDYQRARFWETVGGVWIEIAIIVLVGGVAAVFGGLPVTPDGPELALFLCSMVLLVPLKFTVSYLSTLACFWTENFVGVLWARQAVTALLSGALVPLAYFPDWLATAATWSPFAGLTSTPALIFIGQVSGSEAVLLVAVQLGWVVVLWYAARALFRGALRQLTVHGG